jgi:hypothetical protein
MYVFTKAENQVSTDSSFLSQGIFWSFLQMMKWILFCLSHKEKKKKNYFNYRYLNYIV